MEKLKSQDHADIMRSDPSQCCRLCGSDLKHTFVDLGMSPLCESFLTAQQLDECENFYPLKVLVCDSCFLVQLKEYVSPTEIFDEYAYFSSYSTTWVEHARRYTREIKKRLGLDSKSLVVEVASNDGYLLQHFLPLGVPVLGIEPAGNVAKAAIEKGVPTQIAFFGKEKATQLVSQGKMADLIVGNNVLAQVPDLNDFVAGLAILLKPDGVVTLEFPHLERLIAENQFDTIYHEHFSYFSCLTVAMLAERHGLKLVDVEELPTHGGSLRVYLAKVGSRHIATTTVNSLIGREKQNGLDQIATYASFTDQVRRTKRQFLKFLIRAKEDGKKVCGYGAPGKGNTFLNYCGIGTDFVDFTVDRNPYKHGRFTPGTHIPIYPVEMLADYKPDYVFILPWNLKDEIRNQLSFIHKWGGRFVVAIPELLLIDPKPSIEAQEDACQGSLSCNVR